MSLLTSVGKMPCILLGKTVLHAVTTNRYFFFCFLLNWLSREVGKVKDRLCFEVSALGFCSLALDVVKLLPHRVWVSFGNNMSLGLKTCLPNAQHYRTCCIYNAGWLITDGMFKKKITSLATTIYFKLFSILKRINILMGKGTFYLAYNGFGNLIS